MKKIILIYCIIILAAFFNTTAAENTYYTVVISSVKSAQAAQKLADEMIKKGFEANVMLTTINTGSTNRVCIGKSATKAGAEETQKKLEKAGYTSSWIAVINPIIEQETSLKPQSEKKQKPQLSETDVKKEDTKVEKSKPMISKNVVKSVKTNETAVTESKLDQQTYTVDDEQVNNKKVTSAKAPAKLQIKKEKIETPVVAAVPLPPDVDKMPLALPKEMQGNSSSVTAPTVNTTQSTTGDIITTELKVVTSPSVNELNSSNITTDKDVTVYHIGVSPANSASSDAKLQSDDIIATAPVAVHTISVVNTNQLKDNKSLGLVNSETIITDNNSVIAKELIISRDETHPISATTVDTLEIMTESTGLNMKLPKKAEPMTITDGSTVTTYIVTTDDKGQNVQNVTSHDVFAAKKTPESSSISTKSAVSEKNPQMESIIPGTTLTYAQFYTEIKKIFYALEKYSLASGTLLNEYIEPNYGTYIRFRNNGVLAYEKMVKPKDIYKNPVVKANVLMFFQDMVKIRRQPAVIESLPQYDCALKHIPGLNIYLSSLEKDNKFYDETVKYLKSTGAALTDADIETILGANNSINAAFAIGSSELLKCVYFAIEGNKIYLRYIDLYDNCN